MVSLPLNSIMKYRKAQEWDEASAKRFVARPFIDPVRTTLMSVEVRSNPSQKKMMYPALKIEANIPNDKVRVEFFLDCRAVEVLLSNELCSFLEFICPKCCP